MRSESFWAWSTDYLPPSCTGGPLRGLSRQGRKCRPAQSSKIAVPSKCPAEKAPQHQPQKRRPGAQRENPSPRHPAPRGPQAKKSPRPARALSHWRRGRDSNPRYVSVRLISSQVQSTTLPPLLNFVHSAWPVTAKSSILYRTRARLKPSARTIRQDTGGAPPAPRSSRPPAGSSRAPPPGCGRRPGPSRSRCARIRSCPARS